MGEADRHYRETGNPRRSAVHLTAEGLVEERRLTGPATTPWADIARVEWRSHDVARVVTRRGSIPLDARIDDLPGLVAETNRFIMRHGLHTVLTPNGVAERLGLEPGGGGSMVIDLRRRTRIVLGIVSVVTISIAAALPPSGSGPVARWFAVLLFLAGLWMAEFDLPVLRVRADAHGIDLERASGRRRYAWTDVEAVAGPRSEMMPAVDGVWLSLGGRDGVRLDAVGRAVLDARRLPYAPPGPRPVAETMLSRAEAPDTASVERGLSRDA